MRSIVISGTSGKHLPAIPIHDDGRISCRMKLAGIGCRRDMELVDGASFRVPHSTR